MINILKKMLKTGVVTRSYPFSEAPEKYRGKILVTEDLCDGCQACVNICPADAIHFYASAEGKDAKLVFDYTKCMYCGLCAEVCPTDALEQSNQMKNSVRDKADLKEEFLITKWKGDEENG